MHKQRIYIDTSVIGGCFDDEFAKWSEIFISEILAGSKIAVISDVTIKEIEIAPRHIYKLFQKIIGTDIEIIQINDEIELLAEKYIEYKVITDKFKEDALHIAAASVSKVDILVSWNFKHTVNYRRINLYNSINLMFGYSTIDIRSPREVIDESENF
jgi:hypothetical protein